MRGLSPRVIFGEEILLHFLLLVQFSEEFLLHTCYVYS